MCKSSFLSSDFDNAKFPVPGGLFQPRGGDSSARCRGVGLRTEAQSLRGVDIIENCEVIGIRIEEGHVTGC